MPPEPKKRIRAALRQLELTPEQGKPLGRELMGYSRYVVGNYRIVYKVEDREIRVRAIDPRSVVYARLTLEIAGMAAERRPKRWRRLPATLRPPARRRPRRSV